MVINQGPLEPAKPSLKIPTSRDMDNFLQAALEAPTAAKASVSWTPAKPKRGNRPTAPGPGTEAVDEEAKWCALSYP